MRRPLLIPSLALLMLALIGVRAVGHPHIWVSVEATVLYKEGTITGLRQRWTFDPLYAAMAVDGLDKNKDGKLSKDELQELAKVNVEALKEFGYFTALRLAGVPQKFTEPSTYWLEYGPGEGPAGTGAAARTAAPKEQPGVFGRMWRWMTARDGADAAEQQVLSLIFDLDLAQPILAEAQGVTFAIRDPNFYIAFDPARTNPVRLGPGAPAGCSVTVGQMDMSSEDAQRLSQLIAGTGEGGMRAFGSFGTTASIQCGKK